MLISIVYQAWRVNPWLCMVFGASVLKGAIRVAAFLCFAHL